MSEGKVVSVEGMVEQKVSSKGSKSEHNAFYLVTKGKQFLLRKRGENPFQTSFFASFEGKAVRCNGIIDDYVLFVDEIKSI